MKTEVSRRYCSPRTAPRTSSSPARRCAEQQPGQPDRRSSQDGVEALEYLRRQGAYAAASPATRPSSLLDIKMPRMDGLEVLREIRGDPALKLLPVVILTSSREEQDVITSYELGVNAYVVKPIEFSELHRRGQGDRRLLGAGQRAAGHSQTGLRGSGPKKGITMTADSATAHDDQALRFLCLEDSPEDAQLMGELLRARAPASE